MNNKGETIVETLAAILIISVCFIMLQNSITTAAKINNKTSKENIPFVLGEEESCDIEIIRNGISSKVNEYSCKKSEGDYYYYEKD